MRGERTSNTCDGGSDDPGDREHVRLALLVGHPFLEGHRLELWIGDREIEPIPESDQHEEEKGAEQTFEHRANQTDAARGLGAELGLRRTPRIE